MLTEGARLKVLEVNRHALALASHPGPCAKAVAGGVCVCSVKHVDMWAWGHQPYSLPNTVRSNKRHQTQNTPMLLSATHTTQANTPMTPPFFDIPLRLFASTTTNEVGIEGVNDPSKPPRDDPVVVISFSLYLMVQCHPETDAPVSDRSTT